MFKICFFIFILISILTGCASVPSFKNESVTTPSKKGGGYYLDDGPGDHPPENIDAIPDATPRVEPFNARANQPYIALDNKYTPMTSFYPYKERLSELTIGVHLKKIVSSICHLLQLTN
ncbi:MAG: hypothetical protein EBW02_03910 [Methylophilaceae bacterium]|nr:hypothetical protein [Methylophilaceae bacterium]